MPCPQCIDTGDGQAAAAGTPPAIQASMSARASRSAMVVPMGGIWLDGRRDFARTKSALRSGRPGVSRRDAPSGAEGIAQWPA